MATPSAISLKSVVVKMGLVFKRVKSERENFSQEAATWAMLSHSFYL